MSSPEVSVKLPTSTSPSRDQTIIGKRWSLSPDIEEFRGIPFGFVPGRWIHSQLRKELPVDEFDAAQNGPKCPQPSPPNDSRTFQAQLDFPSDVTESEIECLNLFIIRPSKEALARIGKENELLPVFVWIHGGGFGFGAGTDPMWDPTRLVYQSLALKIPIIAISINYRLNIFGFGASADILSCQTSADTKGCNFGLRDQYIGLQWISQNISHFGGSPEMITIGGQSAGAASVHAQLLAAKMSPAKPLFRKAVLQSGSLGCLGPSPLSNGEIKWEALCKKFDVEGQGMQRVEKLRALDEKLLSKASWELNWMPFNSILDGITLVPTEIGSEVLINWEDLASKPETQPNQQPIEALIGDTDNEGSVFSSRINAFTSYSQIRAVFHSVYPSPSAAEQILGLYNLTSSTPIANLHANLTNFITDTMFGLPRSEASDFFRIKGTKASHHETPVREYKVKFGNPFPGPSFKIAHHCVDLIYTFDAFHDFLIEADKAEAQGSTPPSSLVPPLEAPKEAYGAKRSNVELRDEMQSDWIQFVVRDEVQEQGDGIKVYGNNRVSKLENLTKEEEWIVYKKRLEVLGREKDAAKNALKKINGW